ncbi:MAG: DUF481 domain-containing protein [Planctomycetes bacterium]|nr:DUF481 domain-containing protein [Planctomycetota bacterium]
MHILALVLTFLAGSLFADEVTLKNGDKLTGKVLSLAEGRLRFETAHSGIVSIDWNEIASLKTEATTRLRLRTGELLEGTLSPGAPGRLKVHSEGVAEPVEVEFAQVKTLNEPPAEWHGSIDLAARATDGNTHTTTALLGMEATRATEVDALIFKAVFRYGDTRGIVTERNGYGLIKYDYLFTETIYGYTSGELFSDRFQDLTLRTIVSAGLGHIFARTPETELRADVGLAFIANDFRDADDEAHAGARVSAFLRQALPLGMEVTDTAALYPNFEHGSDWQFRNDAALATAVGESWSLRVGMITEFDNDPPDGRRKYDNIYYLGLRYKF